MTEANNIWIEMSVWCGFAVAIEFLVLTAGVWFADHLRSTRDIRRLKRRLRREIREAKRDVRRIRAARRLLSKPLGLFK